MTSIGNRCSDAIAELDGLSGSFTSGSGEGRTSSFNPAIVSRVEPSTADAYDAVPVLNLLLPLRRPDDERRSEIMRPPLAGGGLLRLICVNATSALD